MTANGEANRDGQDENFSWNNGVEGPSQDDTLVLRRRQADARGLLATLFASRGTLLIWLRATSSGSSQHGNNNAYAQDNAITWTDWQSRDLELEDFVAKLAALRSAHPELKRTEFVADASWYDLDGTVLTSEMWESEKLAGFEVHIREGRNHTVAIRIDRIARQCVLTVNED